MLARFLLVVVIAVGTGLQACAADLSLIKRYIRKEPAYQEAPKYCLMVFGKEADTRIWLVLDGKTLYVDVNGNRDLTEAVKKWTNERGTFFRIPQIVENDGSVHKDLQVNSFGNGTFTLRIGHQEHRQQYAGIGRMDKPTWGDKPDNAPIIHFNGPMTLERYGPVYTLPRMGATSQSRAYKLRLLLGTPGLGQGTFASYNDVCSENLGPIQADIEYASPNPAGPPIKQRVELLHDG